MLETAQIKLRALEPADVDFLFAEENNPEIWELSSTLIPFSKNTLTAYADSIHDLSVQKQFRFIIVEKATEKIIGMLDLFEYDAIHRRVGVGIIISDKSAREKGYAFQSLDLIKQYCREVLHLKQIFCSIMSHNKSSIALFEKTGFTPCGIRKSWYLNAAQQWEDELLYQYLLA